jgi:hypothetical protein
MSQRRSDGHLGKAETVNQTFLHLVFLAHELSRGFDLSLMRNDETTVEESACDAVSQALAALGINKSPRAIKDLLVHKSASRVREIVQAIQDFNQRQREAGKPDMD